MASELPLYRISGWDEHFECAQSRKTDSLRWVAMPNRFDGDGYTVLVDHVDGGAHFGAWCAIVEVASKCTPRGTLIRDNGTPHTPATLARMTRISESVFSAAIDRLCSDEIGWIEVVNQSTTTRLPVGYQSATSQLPPQYNTDRQDKQHTHAGARAREGAENQPPYRKQPEIDRIQMAASRFPEFWQRYPNPINQVHAAEAFTRAVVDGADPDEIIAGIATSPQTNRDERRFIPPPTKWLDGRGWLDPAAQTTETAETIF